MKNSCNAVLLISLLAVFANAQDTPPPLPSDSSLAIVPDSSLPIAQESSLPIAQDSSLPIVQDSSSPIAQESSLPIANASGQEKKDYQKNLRAVVYLHPLPLFFGAAYNMFMFSSTYEMPLDLSNSVVIQPTVWLGSSDGFIANTVEYEKLKRIGGGIGIRHYAVDKGQGFYLQTVASAYYINAESISHKEENSSDDGWYLYDKITTWTKVKGMVSELMFYIGVVHKWQNMNFSYEGGMGFGYDGTKTFQMGYINRLATNFNINVGIPF
jgi:hypothetical protein